MEPMAQDKYRILSTDRGVSCRRKIVSATVKQIGPTQDKSKKIMQYKLKS